MVTCIVMHSMIHRQTIGLIVSEMRPVYKWTNPPARKATRYPSTLFLPGCFVYFRFSLSMAQHFGDNVPSLAYSYMNLPPKHTDTPLLESFSSPYEYTTYAQRRASQSQSTESTSGLMDLETSCPLYLSPTEQWSQEPLDSSQFTRYPFPVPANCPLRFELPIWIFQIQLRSQVADL